MANKFFPF
ncbi:hypothetical protein P5673_021124 [Acropora cervicornis]|uniref:Uncharacterized protein n=1 Tax=Acropora cervicornis TaxID=6130 RepID=A0AAD9V0P2_ACRCE|nr:hypothetical protein P5673_021124 [Acropora cervicornis]